MIKKVLALTLAVCMAAMCTISASAFTYPAGGVNGTNTLTPNTALGSSDVSISVTTVATTEKYAVDLGISDVTFTYTLSGRTWNPTTHLYEVSGSGSWAASSGSDTFTVSNHSSLPINVSADAVAGTTTYGTVEASVTLSAASLARCNEGVAVGSEPSLTGEIAITGAPSSSVTSLTDANIATVTVYISPAP